MYWYRQRRRSASDSSRVPLDVITTSGRRVGAHRAELGNRQLEVRQQLQQIGLEGLVGAVDLVDQQHRRLVAVIASSSGRLSR